MEILAVLKYLHVSPSGLQWWHLSSCQKAAGTPVCHNVPGGCMICSFLYFSLLQYMVSLVAQEWPVHKGQGGEARGKRDLPRPSLVWVDTCCSRFTLEVRVIFFDNLVCVWNQSGMSAIYFGSVHSAVKVTRIWFTDQLWSFSETVYNVSSVVDIWHQSEQITLPNRPACAKEQCTTWCVQSRCKKTTLFCHAHFFSLCPKFAFKHLNVPLALQVRLWERL